MSAPRGMSYAAGTASAPVTGSPRYVSSRLYAVCDAAGRRLSRMVVAAFSWAERSAKASVAGQAAAAVASAWRNAATGSLLVRVFWPMAKMALAPYGEPLTVETFLGLALAVACVAPTEVVMLAGAFVLAAMLWDRSRRADREGERLWAFPGFGTVLAVSVVFVFLAGATASSVDPAKSLYNLIIWVFYLLFFFMAADASLRGRVENAVWPFLMGASLSGLVGIYQKFTGFVPAKSWLDTTFEDSIVRMVGTFSNPTFFAEILGLALPVTVALILKKTAWQDRLVLLGFAGVQGLAMVLTYSRGAWLGLIASLCLVAVLYEGRLLLLGLVAGGLGIALAPHVLLQRLVSSFSLTDSSNSYRIFIWRGSLAMLKANLLRGIGLGAESFSKVYPEYMIIQTPAPHAHSTFLEFLIEVGLFGFIAMAWLFLAWTSDVTRALVSQKGKRNARWVETGVLAGVVGAIAGHLLQGVIEYTWYSPKITVAFWALMGMGSGIAASLSSHRSRGAEQAGGQTPGSDGVQTI